MRFGFWVGFKQILENCVFFAVFDPFYYVNEAKTSNQFPLMKTSTEIFQFFCAISVHKKAPKKHQHFLDMGLSYSPIYTLCTGELDKDLLQMHAVAFLELGDKYDVQ